MAIKSLSDTHQIVRHVPKKLLDDQGNPLPQAFELRLDEDYLSAAWLERYSGMRAAKLAGVAVQISRTRTIKASDVLSVGNVGEIKDACADFNQTIRINHEPDEQNSAYVAVRRIKTDNLALLELLAKEVWCDNCPAGGHLQSIGPWLEC